MGRETSLRQGEERIVRDYSTLWRTKYKFEMEVGRCRMQDTSTEYGWYEGLHQQAEGLMYYLSQVSALKTYQRQSYG